MRDAYDKLTDAVMSVADWMAAHGVKSTHELGQHVDALKTEAYYQRALDQAVRDFYGGKIDAGAFIDKQMSLVEGQLTRAWNEGMRAVGLDPVKDMTGAYQRQLDDVISKEMNYILDFAADIEAAAKAGTPIDPLRARVEYWVNRYTQVVNEAQIACKPIDLYEWQYGDVIRHCDTCAELNGVVMTGKEWHDSPFHPQQPPNERLDCGGWRCRCRLVPTELSWTGYPPGFLEHWG